jgi:hypothetical protein
MSDVRLTIEVDRSLCVLCGGPNDCVLARGDGKSDERCWCVGKTFTADLLAKATAKDDGASCVCRKCLDRDLQSRRSETAS